MNMEKKYHAKIMIAGEYGVLKGGPALTIPFRKYAASLEHSGDGFPRETVISFVNSLRNLYTYLKALPTHSFYATCQLGELENALHKGYFINSNIPQGYG